MVRNQSKSDYLFYIPGNLPLIGDLLSFLQNPILAWGDAIKADGDLCKINLAGKHFTLLLLPETIDAVLVGHHDKLSKSDPFFNTLRGLLGEGLLTLTGDAWQSRRKLMMPVFNHNNMVEYSKIIGDTALEVMGEWEFEYGEKEAPAYLNKMIMNLTLRVIINCLFGRNALSSSDCEKISQSLDILISVVIPKAINPIKIPEFMPSLGNLKMAKCRALFYPIVESLIEKQSTNPEGNSSLFGAMQASQRKEGLPVLSKEEMRDEIITMILAGHETTANSLSWMFYLFQKHPDAAAMLEAEWQKFGWTEYPAISDLGKMRETSAFINESLRMFPPIWGIARQVTEEFSYKNRVFKAGDNLTFLPYLTHRLAEYWPNPEQFDPNRFKNRKDEVSGAFIPFGIGPRVCVGKHFALVEMLVLLPAILSKFKFAFKEEDVSLSIGVTLRPGSKLPVKILPRVS